MDIKGIALTMLLLCISNMYSQEVKTAKNTIYSELIGNTASAISINYDRILLKRGKTALSLNIGAGMVPTNIIKFKYSTRINYIIYAIPVSANLLIGKRNNHIELGAGCTFQQGTYGVGIKYTQTLFGVIRLGYRYQKDTGGFFWKAGFTPFIPLAEYGDITFEETSDLPFLPLAGVAFGYTF